MLLRDLWSQKLDWGDIVSKEFQNLWSALSCDLAKPDSLQFPRFVISEDGLAVSSRRSIINSCPPS